jgi:hypothetical protein
MTPTRVPRQVAALHERRRGVDPQAGQATAEILMWSAVVVGVIVVIGAALQVLGVDVIDRMRSAVGL